MNGHYDLAQINTDWFIEQISYVDNHPHIFQDTLRNNLTLWDHSYSDQTIQEVLNRVNLSDFQDRLDTFITSNSLSTGQKQRIAIARMLLLDKPFLLMDEGLANVDAVSAQEIEDTLLADPSLTYLAISHHFSPERLQEFDQVVQL